jgi:hypothetical protein
LFENVILRRIYEIVRKERKSEGRKKVAKEGSEGMRLVEN